MPAKNKIIGVRVDESTAARLELFEASTKVESVTLCRAALDAALNYFDEHNRISFPLEIRPSDDSTQSPKARPSAKRK